MWRAAFDEDFLTMLAGMGFLFSAEMNVAGLF
jgi:hypothetical protein